MDLKESLKHLPERPGIYFMKDSLGIVIYVGKAKSLKARVSQYFQKNRNNSSKVNEMIGHIDSFEHITTDTELEAFLLECKKIKELKPRYNRLLKNHKGYMYIKISTDDAYPKISKTTGYIKDSSAYFGPFTSEGSVDAAIQFIKDYYPVRKCSSGALSRNSSGCLNFHLGICVGPCRGNDVREIYRSYINNILLFLDGKDYSTVKVLHAKMKEAANNLEFEKAAQFRDQLKGVRHVLNKQRIIKVSKYGRIILAAERFGEFQTKLFLIKGNKLLYLESVSLDELSNNSMEEKLRGLIVGNLKALKNNGEYILSQEDIDEAQIIYSYLKRKSNGVQSFKIPLSRIDKVNYTQIAQLILQT